MPHQTRIETVAANRPAIRRHRSLAQKFAADVIDRSTPPLSWWGPPSTVQISLKPASGIKLWVGGHQGVTQLLTAGQSDFYQETARIAVAKRSIAENRVISGLERALGPARACQNSGARDLEDPRARRRGVLGVGLDDEGNVRIGPIDGLDGGFHGFGVLEIVCRI